MPCPSVPSRQTSVSTGWPLRACRVVAPMKRCALAVMTTRNSHPPLRRVGGGVAEAAVAGGLVLGVTAHEAAAQLLLRRRQQEDEDGSVHARPDPGGALHVDLEHDVLAAVERLLDARLGGAVELTVHLGPLEELATLGHGKERIPVDEGVGNPVDLARAGRA